MGITFISLIIEIEIERIQMNNNISINTENKTISIYGVTFTFDFFKDFTNLLNGCYKLVKKDNNFCIFPLTNYMEHSLSKSCYVTYDNLVLGMRVYFDGGDWTTPSLGNVFSVSKDGFYPQVSVILDNGKIIHCGANNLSIPAICTSFISKEAVKEE